MASNLPMVSVVIPSYNHGKYIAATIKSVLDQTILSTAPDAVEIVIVDDGSTDDSQDIINGFQSGQIVLYTQENRGADAAINRGVALARGKYISILNSDDLYHPSRLEKIVDAFEKEPEALIAFSNVEFIDGDGGTIKSGKECEWLKDGLQFYKENGDLRVSLIKNNFLCTSSNLVFKKSLFEAIGGFKAFRYVHDLDFLLKALSEGDHVYMDETLLSYRLHSHNTIKEQFDPNSSLGRDHLFEMAWIVATFIAEQSKTGTINVENLLGVLDETYKNSQELILQCSLLYNSHVSFHESRWVLDRYIRSNQDRTVFLKKLESDAALLMEKNNSLGKTNSEFGESNHWLCESINKLSGANCQLLEQQNHLSNQINELSGEVEKQRGDLQCLEQQNQEMEQQNQEMALENRELEQQSQKMAGENHELEQQNHEIWQAKEYFSKELEIVLRSKRFRLISLLVESAKPGNLKRNLFNLVRRLLPVQVKHRLKQMLYTKKWVQKKHHGPLISVIVPCYNYGRYLDRLMESLLKQTFQEFEIILVDDGSTDEFTVQKISQLELENLPNLRIFRQENQGVIAARNSGVAKASGKYIFPLDADDYIDPTLFEKALFYLESSSPDCFVYSWSFITGESEFVWKTTDIDPNVILEENRAGTPFFSKAAFEKIGGYNEKMREGYEDWEFCVNLVGHGYVGKVIPEPLYCYHVKNGARNYHARKKHAMLKKLITTLHRDTLEQIRPLLEKKNRRVCKVLDPLVNLKRDIKQMGSIGSEKDSCYLIDLFSIPYEPVNVFPLILSLCEQSDRKVMVVMDGKWAHFFDHNKKKNLHVYYPEHYHGGGEGAHVLEYLRCVYSPVEISMDDLLAVQAETHKEDKENKDKKINILYLAPWLITGGADSMAVDWFANLNQDHFKKYFVSTLEKENEWLLKIKDHAEEIYDLPALGVLDENEQRNFLLDLIKQKEIQVVHIMNSSSGFNALPAIKEQFPMVTTVAQFHCFDYLENGEEVGYPLDIPGAYDPYIDYYNIEYSDLKTRICDLFPSVDPAKFKIIHGCIDTNNFDSKAVDSSKAYLELTGKRKTDARLDILFVGRLDYQKQPLMMAKVAAELRDRGMDFIIHVVGDGSLQSQKGKLQAYIKNNGLEDYVILHGSQPMEALTAWYAACDVLLMTSLWEGIPMVIYQSMSMGLPCIAPDTGGISELVNSETGVLIKRNENVVDYVDAVTWMMEDPKRINILGANARKLIEEQFSIENLKQEYEAFYCSQVAN